MDSVNSSKSQVCPSDFPISFSKVQYQSSTINDSAIFFVILFNVIICPFAITFNTAMLTVIIRDPNLLSLKNTSILFLTVADLLVSTFGQISFIANELGILIHGRLQCSAVFATNLYTELFTIGLSFFTLKVMTLERFLAIFCPYWFHRWATKRRVCFAYALTWVSWTSYITVVKFSPEIPESTYTSVLTGFIFTNLLFTLSVYSKINRLRKQAHVTPNINQHKTAEEIAQRRASRTVVYINAALFISYFPTFLVGILHYSKIVTDDVLIYHVLYPLAQTVSFKSAVVDPIIYAWRTSEIRESLRRLLRKKGLSRNNRSVQSRVG
ncbi:adrenocorticotropic hormone receptor-like [Actinia tenebrosa]|uniref:Adrenocorticotropic hormone receptor-like n=1 Tax=Actinia tenebrosa TaxID=6105 RepID=A0A6P8H085_ACTTE|nr:adrenocorticotropic hormone receptor-like [Actinia tenebrosa]